jgi:23S rRNA pseudouridine1911/1915/1917 synthase
MEPRIIYEDECILALNKPSGLLVHAAPGSDEETLSDWLLKKYPALANVGEPHPLPDGTQAPRPGIVHRLDKETSGIMLVARTPEAFTRLKRQFARRDVQKTYRAFVYGTVKEERGIIDRPLGRTRGSGSRRSVKDPHGELREAQTVFRRIGSGKEASHLEVFPKTGRTHQIRVHFSSIGHPVILDALYAPGRPALLGFSRLALHAFSLSFEHPQTKERMALQAPLPPEFIAAEEELRRE